VTNVLLSSVTETTFGCPGAYTVTLDSMMSASSDTYTPISQAYYSNCREDDVVVYIVFIAVLEFIIRKIYDLLSYSFLYCFSNKRKIGESFKSPFNPGVCAVDNFIFNIQLYAIISYFPYITFITPLLLLAEFKFDVFKLKSMRSKPIKFNLKKENGHLIMILFKLTIVFICIFSTLFYISLQPHGNYVQVTKSHNYIIF
jgi:hypothetical protein